MKPHLPFFTKGRPPERIRYYDLSDIKVGKETPRTLKHFEEFFRSELNRSDRSAVVSRAQIEAGNYDLKAVNLHRKNPEDTGTPVELLAFLEVKG